MTRLCHFMILQNFQNTEAKKITNDRMEIATKKLVDYFTARQCTENNKISEGGKYLETLRAYHIKIKTLRF